MLDKIEDAMKDGLSKGLEKSVPSIVDTCVDALWEHPWYSFIAGGQLRLVEAGMNPKEAWNLARKVLIEHVKSEKLKFGEPGFDWGPQGGRAIIEECEIEHWDAA